MACTEKYEKALSNADRESREEFNDALVQEMPHLKRYALSMVKDTWQADDLVQDCMLRAMRKRHQYHPGTHRRRWLFTILRNLYLDWRRQCTRQGPHVALKECQTDTRRRTPQDDWMALVDLRRSLKRLRSCEREVLFLNAFSRLSQRDIAYRLGIAEGTVRSRLSRARSALTG
ncbi:RNA polymerase sigma factor [Leisingera sp. JC1]|uniref:RNA polymerase sigma factor n=1 Tax=Leisingera sp. JC1 TaxID=1855282 RepID=UPI0009F72345|nr:RNA polymerase sigma factor [Leisingera sp. JC1]